MNAERPNRILLIEDEQADAEFTTYAFDHGALNHELTVRATGSASLEFLIEAAKSVTLPDIVLLDVNLPDMTGMEVLATIRATPELTHLPVIVLSTSSYSRDIYDMYAGHANAFVQKPHRLSGFESLVHAIEQFWLSAALLPTVVPEV
jgi:CheY-like chemotaxis protein